MSRRARSYAAVRSSAQQRPARAEQGDDGADGEDRDADDLEGLNDVFHPLFEVHRQ